MVPKCRLVAWLVLILRPFLVQASDDIAEYNPDGPLQHHTSVPVVIGNSLRGRRKTAVKVAKAPTRPRTKAPTTTKSTKSTKALSESPSMSPSACYDPADVDAVIDILSVISDTCLMLQDGTPQNLAYQFVSSDPFLSLGSATDAEWLQRYALAVFYYSTSGSAAMDASWVEHTKDECIWTFISNCVLGSVTKLSFGRVGLAGTIPSELSALTELTNLYAYSNSFSGTLPTELAALTGLTIFSVFENLITGTIPTEYGLLTNLVGFSSYQNQLTGPIPSELGNIGGGFNYLMLSNNTLTGTIPTELGQLSDLLYLNLYDNNLSGPIPTELGLITSLQTFQLYDNPKLTPTIPTEVCAVLSGSVVVKTDWCSSYASCCP